MIKIIPGNRTKMRILLNVYLNEGININELIRKTRASPNLVLKYVDDLEKYEVLNQSRTKGKRGYERRLFINFDSNISSLLFSLVEANRRFELLEKYARLKGLFEQISHHGKFALLYGSYARKSADKESDIDIIIVGDKLDKERIREILITYPEASLKIESVKEFIKNLGKPLYKSIMKEHIVISNEFNFLSLLKKLFNK